MWRCVRASAGGQAKNTARLTMLFALVNLWMVRQRIAGLGE
jgi:hypothetical protein